MKKGLIALGLMGLLGAFGVGCGNVCDDAADICVDAADGSGSASGSSDAAEPECSGAYECQSQCVVDADSCDFTNEDLAKCYADCAA